MNHPLPPLALWADKRSILMFLEASWQQEGSLLPRGLAVFDLVSVGVQ